MPILNNKKISGFTLLELLIVIAVIGLLASAVMVQFPNATKKARDVQRLQDMHQILLALRLYYSTYGRYPSISPDSCCDGWDEGPCGNNPFIGALVSSGLVTKVPTDPEGNPSNGCQGYSYYRYGAGSYGCDASRGPFFVLGIRDMKTTGRPYPESPGWSCPNRNWQNEFDWVTGGFEK